MTINTAIKPDVIAKSYHWDGEHVFDAMCEALTECNFHDLRDQLEECFVRWQYAEQLKWREEFWKDWKENNVAK